MSEIARNVVGPACHGDWHDYLRERLSYDNWRTDEALLLLAGIWPIEAEISNSSVSSPRYGVIEPPVVIHAGLLDQECSVQFRDDYQRLLILAGRRLRLIRALWESGNHLEARYPPAYFAQWAESKNLTPCWLNIWQDHLAMAKHTMGSQASLPQDLPETSAAPDGAVVANTTTPDNRMPVSPVAVIPISPPAIAPTLDAWVAKARDFAGECIKRHKENGLFPSQSDVCSEVETRMLENKIFGSHGRPLAAAYIGRSAIQGEWWKRNKP